MGQKYRKFGFLQNQNRSLNASMIGGKRAWSQNAHGNGTNQVQEKKKKNLHQLVITDFRFDDFDVEELRLDKSIEQGGDFKPISSK